MRAAFRLTFLLLLLLCAPAEAAGGETISPGQTVAVFPLTYRYTVSQDYTRTVIESDAYLKGNFRENGRDSSRVSTQGRDSGSSFSSSFNDAASANASHNALGNYDLKKGGRVSGESFRDRTVVEKHVDSMKLTGTLESALSQAGVRLVDRSTMDKVFAERKKMTDPEFAPAAVQRATKMRIADYMLTGQIESYRVEGVRTVPDGSNSRYAVGGVVKINIKLVTQDGTSAFARTFTGRARTTFDKADPVPAEEVMEAAMDSLATQLVSALTGMGPAEASEDAEYQDSPGKRLK